MSMPETKLPESWGKGKPFGRSFWLFAALAVLSGVLCYRLKGQDVFIAALAGDLDLFMVLLPRMAAAMLMAGLVQVLLSREFVARWVGGQSGIRGIFIAEIAGILTPGGPMTSFPLVVAFHMSGADRGALVAYLTAWSLLGLQRMLVWEIPLMGTEFAFLRLLAGLALPIIAGLIARKLPFGPIGVKAEDA
jgi:uncharacterized membrane protein YraQ (UPF0718 family)